MSCRGFTAHFFLALCSVPLSGWTQFVIHLLKDVLVASMSCVLFVHVAVTAVRGAVEHFSVSPS